MESIEARCMKCRKQVVIKDGKGSVTKNHMMIIKGQCPECGTNVCRILGRQKKEDEEREIENVINSPQDG